MSDAEAAFDEIGQGIEGAVAASLFGKRCYKINGKPFVSFSQDCMVFKLTGAAHTSALGREGAVRFDPSRKGRPMREWIQVPAQHIEAWPELAIAARDYVANLK